MGIFVFFSDLRRKTFSLSPLNKMVTWGFSYNDFYYRGNFLLFLIWWVFLWWKDVEFCHYFSASTKMIMWSYFLHYVNVVYYMGWFLSVEPSLHVSNNPTWSWLQSFCYAAEFCLLVFCWNFCISIPWRYWSV